jgi:predicted MFS family arabinose efflux permease
LSNQSGGWSVFQQRYALTILSLAAIVNLIDRQVISILLEPMKRDLGATDTQMGLLTGTAFSIFYVGASLPMARWADRGVRRSILAGSIAAWSVLTAVCGLTQNFLQLAIARAGVAVAESGAVPISQSLLSDIFPPARRATVFGILTAASSIGLGTGLFLGGWINDMFNWRTAFFVVGLPGLILAALLRFTVPEPAKRDLAVPLADGAPKASLVRTLKESPTLVWLMVVTALVGIATYAFIAWGATFFLRTHSLSVVQVGLWLGLATVIGQAGGHAAAGFLADFLAGRDKRWYVWLPALGTLAAVPFGLLFLFSHSNFIALAGFALFQVFKSAWLSPTYAIALRITPSSMKAQISAALTSCMTLVGLGLGPLLVGFGNDLLEPSFGQAAIRYSLSVVVLLLLPIAAIYLSMAKSLDARTSTLVFRD